MQELVMQQKSFSFVKKRLTYRIEPYFTTSSIWISLLIDLDI